MIVFVHGVPETAAIWDEIRAKIARPSVAVALPGFACSRPAGFGGTKDDYVLWLVAEIDRVAAGERVDLVGHDWGAQLTYRVATAYGDRLRSWVADVGNSVHPDFVWHDFARVMQTPGEGEELMAAYLATSATDRVAVFESMGVPSDCARRMAEAADEQMAASMLGLYRSAVPNPYADWGPLSPTMSPGLIIDPVDDAFSEERLVREVATILGARFERFEGAGHFWAYQASDKAAALLEKFWSSLDNR
ncbi:alpha/beta fold hydrolase [Nocardia miyunensis]|uniref:alpha/beta fold hydrolase n=1 Tax=Nocardia miyunensis TaxID=282684 RepID=UPI0008297586|nr:alpha/beta hydrolase [Nocardia miyunensis]